MMVKTVVPKLIVQALKVFEPGGRLRKYHPSLNAPPFTVGAGSPANTGAAGASPYAFNRICAALLLTGPWSC